MSIHIQQELRRNPPATTTLVLIDESSHQRPPAAILGSEDLAADRGLPSDEHRQRGDFGPLRLTGTVSMLVCALAHSIDTNVGTFRPSPTSTVPLAIRDNLITS